MVSERTIFDRLHDYIEYAESVNRKADVEFYKELYMLIGTQLDKSEVQALLKQQREIIGDIIHANLIARSHGSLTANAFKHRVLNAPSPLENK